jgi:D-alanine-D-alanine ligase
MTDKIRIAVLYGGRSGEHEVSLQSAASVIRHLDRERFEVIPVSIDKAGRWQWNDLGLIEQADGDALPILPEAPEMRLARQPGGPGALMPIAGGLAASREVDVVFAAGSRAGPGQLATG